MEGQNNEGPEIPLDQLKKDFKGLLSRVRAVQRTEAQTFNQ